MKKIEALDFARVVAMLSVVMIHVTSTYIFVPSGVAIGGMNLAFMLNQVTRFAVPLFILLSGLSLGLSQSGGSLGGFYKKRIVKIGVPYLVWCSLYFIYNAYPHWENLWAKGLDSLKFYGKSLLLGSPAPHLYFIVIIFQLYLLFPLLKKLVNRSPWISLLTAFLITYIAQKAFYFLKYDFNMIPNAIKPYLWILFPTWLFYFVLGMFFSRERLQKFCEFAEKNILALLSVTAIFSVLYVVDGYVTNSLDAIKLELNIVTFLVFASCLGLWTCVKRLAVAKKLTVFLSNHSMTIYFGHVFVICFFRHFPIFLRGMFGMVLLYACVVVGSVILATLIDKIFQRRKTRSNTGGSE